MTLAFHQTSTASSATHGVFLRSDAMLRKLAATGKQAHLPYIGAIWGAIKLFARSADFFEEAFAEKKMPATTQQPGFVAP